MVQPVPDRLDFPKNEEEILEYWKSIDAFQKSLKLAKGRPRSVPVKACTINIPTQQGMDEPSEVAPIGSKTMVPVMLNLVNVFHA